ncbi:hypothetical protein Syncc8109_0547 [Synechococcus sp. WH 8109]|nr:hypothetical protein Syncc8109_0547 [Synechococcus sp. WH 8109]
MQQPVGARITIQKRGQASVDAPVQPVPLPLGQTHSDGLNHLIADEMPIPQPEFVVVA